MPNLNIEEFLGQLSEQQRAAVVHDKGPLLVIATAGSGKTRIITYRIAYLLQHGIPAKNILAVTFTNMAAWQMQQRLAALISHATKDLWIGTFHCICARILKMHFNKHFVIYDEDDQINVVKECLHVLNFNMSAAKVLQKISQYKEQLIYPQDIVNPSNYLQQIIKQLYTEYQRRLTLANALDFDDLLIFTIQLLQNNKDILRIYQNKFRYILVDEYQDTNHAQLVLLKLLVNSDKNICVVGDDDQAIYSWRGGQVRNILKFEQDFGKAHVVTLNENYRSTEHIVTLAARLIQHNKTRYKKTLCSNRKGSRGIIAFYQAADEISEAQFVVREIEKLRNRYGLNWGDFAILYRTHALSRAVEQVLGLWRLPYRIYGTVNFWERKEIKDILAYLKIITNPFDDLNLLRIINVPPRGIGKITVDKLKNYAACKKISVYEVLIDIDKVASLDSKQKSAVVSFVELLKDLKEKIFLNSAYEFLKYTIEKLNYVEYLNDIPSSEWRLENLHELLSMAGTFDDSYSGSDAVEAFLSQVSLLTDIDRWSESKDAISLMTLHSAKGLEFECVFIVGVEEGIFPHIGADEQEERRLCYVGITRAKNFLYLSYAKKRRRMPSFPSKFLFEAGLMNNVVLKKGKDLF